MANDPVFRAGGLASGLDTNSIIDGLTKLEQRPLDTLRTQQTGFKTQVSLIAQIVSKIGTLYSTAKALSDNGALGIKTTSVNSDFIATPGSSASAGAYSISVQDLATSAQKRSAAFSGTTGVSAGTLEVKVQGTSYGTINITDGEALTDVANDIKGLGAPVNISVLADGSGNSYLSITNKNSGFTTPTAATALELTETTSPTAALGHALGFTNAHTASNAQFTIDGLPFTRQSNTVSDALPGTTLQLKGKTGTDEQLTMDNDTASTATNLQKFVDAYNDIINTVKTAQSIPAGGTRDSSLAGDSSVRGLIGSMQGLITQAIPSLTGGVRTMADLGLKTNFQDGTLSIDSNRLSTAISTDSAAVNKIFSDSLNGVSAQAFGFSQKYTSVISGVLTSRTKGLNDAIKRLDGDADKMQRRIDSFKANLITQFTAMEQLVSGLKSTGNFLTQQSAQPK